MHCRLRESVYRRNEHRRRVKDRCAQMKPCHSSSTIIRRLLSLHVCPTTKPVPCLPSPRFPTHCFQTSGEKKRNSYLYPYPVIHVAVMRAPFLFLLICRTKGPAGDLVRPARAKRRHSVRDLGQASSMNQGDRSSSPYGRPGSSIGIGNPQKTSTISASPPLVPREA